MPDNDHPQNDEGFAKPDVLQPAQSSFFFNQLTSLLAAVLAVLSLFSGLVDQVREIMPIPDEMKPNHLIIAAVIFSATFIWLVIGNIYKRFEGTITDKKVRQLNIYLAAGNLITLVVLIFVTAFMYRTMTVAERTWKLAATEYLAKFPDDMPHIAKLIEGAEESLHILVDFPAYGFVSQPELFAEYRAAIERSLHEKVKIILCYYSEEGRRLALKEQYDKYSTIDELRKEAFFKSFIQSQRVQINSKEEFLETIIKKDIEILEDIRNRDSSGFFHSSSMGGAGSKPPVHVWIADRETAIFSVTHNYDGFETGDRGVVGNFVEYVEQCGGGGVN